MKRAFTFTLAAGIAAGISATAWSQAGQGGGGGGTAGAAAGAGNAGGAATPNAGGVGAAGNAAAVGDPGNVSPGVSGSPAAAGNQGGVGSNNNSAAGNARVGAGAAGNVSGQNPAGANAQGQFNFNGMGQTPFFSDPGARQQLGINDSQFNQLNQAYQQGYQRFNQPQNGTNGVGTNNAAGRQSQQSGVQPGGNAQRLPGAQQGGANQQALQGQAAQQNAQQGIQAQSQSSQSGQQAGQIDVNGDFDSALNSTFSDPAGRQRFNQLNMQYQGPTAFNDPMVQQQLNLDSRQRQNFERMATEWQRDLASFQRGRQTNLTQQQFNDLRTRFMNRMNRVLTPEQQQQWSQMAGEPYEFPYSAYSASGNGSTQSAQPQVQQGLQQDASRQPMPAPNAPHQPPQPQETVR